jgi:hypothetical protein
MTLNRRAFLERIGAASASMCAFRADVNSMSQSRTPAGTVVCRFVDASTGRPVPVRVRFVDARGENVVPLGHPERLTEEAPEGDVRFQSRRFAYSEGEFSFDAGRLPIRYQALKGYEYVIAEGEILPQAARDGVMEVALSRWSNASERHWYSGDIHIHHISPRTCRLEMDAEDLNVANILSSDFTTDQDQFEGKLNSVSAGRHLVYVNQEFRLHNLGHICLLNLKRLIEPVKPMQPYHHPLVRVCDEVHGQGGYVSWAHFPSGPGLESPLDVALEKLDGLEILCVLEPREFSRSLKSMLPELESNDGLRLWYRFLNCGFRLTATAGTDKMSNYVTVGANRVFACVEGDFDYQAWIAALKQGRTFVTNSPMLYLTVNGHHPGATLSLEPGSNRVLRIHAVADSQLPYHRLEIVCNGRVIGQSSPSGVRHHAELSLEHPVNESCWIAARALEDIDPYRRADLDFTEEHIPRGTLHGNYFGTHRTETVFAHTSPVYVSCDGKLIRSWDDADYYVRYLDSAIRWLEREGKFARPADREASIEVFRRGREVYARRAEDARRRSGA